MTPSINKYFPTTETGAVTPSQTYRTYEVDQEADYSISITLRSSDFEVQNLINAKHLETLIGIESLSDNWDGDGALAPPQNVTQYSKAIIYLMNAIGQEIYNIAPGPKGEILIIFDSGKRSFEVLIYPDRMRYVKFPEKGEPSQDNFTPELLFTDLLSWLNSP